MKKASKKEGKLTTSSRQYYDKFFLEQLEFQLPESILGVWEIYNISIQTRIFSKLLYMLILGLNTKF